MKNILVAGGTGFIGHHLLKECVKKGWNTFSLSSGKISNKDKIKNVKYIFLDIRNKDKIKKLKKIKFNVVVNLSGEVDHKLKKKVIDTHFKGVKNLLNNLDIISLKSFVQVGSSAEYGKMEKLQKENVLGSPISYYGKAKLSASNYLLKRKTFSSFSKCVLRLYQVYGPNQKENRIIPYVIKNALLNKTFYCSTGKQIRDFIYIDDVISAIFKSIALPKKVDGKIINIGYGKGYKLIFIINLILKYIGKGHPKFGLIKMRKDEAKSVVPSIALSKKLLNWSPKVSLEKGLKSTIQSFKK